MQLLAITIKYVVAVVVVVVVALSKAQPTMQWKRKKGTLLTSVTTIP